MVSICMIEPAQNEGSMSGREQASRPGGDAAREVPEPARLAVAHATRRPVRWSAHRRRDAWLLLLALLVRIVTIVALSGGITQRPTQVQGTQPGRASLPSSQTQADTPSTALAIGTFR